MKKYYCKETDEQVVFGDVVAFTAVKQIEGGKVTVEKEIEFNEDNMDLFIEYGFVEEREAEEEKDGAEEAFDFNEELFAAYNRLCKDVGDIDKRVENLEAVVGTLKGTILNIQKSLKKNAKPVEVK